MRWIRGLFAPTRSIREHEWLAAESRLSCTRHLDAGQRARLRNTAQSFLEEKIFHGAHGLEVTPAMRLAIALQASLLVINTQLEYYGGFAGIVVYPGGFIVPREREDEAGIITEFEDSLSGEAGPGGPVLISWEDAINSPPGVNLILHEFAHALDVAGMMPGDISPSYWQTTFTRAFEDFNNRLDRGETTALDDYAAENPEEFFAVMTEAFFETPAALEDEYPEVFAMLERFYRQDTRSNGPRL